MVSSCEKTWRYLDAHMILPILDFMEEQGLKSKTEILDARIKAVAGTGMVDYLTELHEEGKVALPEDLATKKAQTLADFESKQSQLKPLLEAVEREGMEALRTSSLADFCIKYQLAADVLDVMFDYARLSYQIGDYKTSSELLKIYRMLTTSADPQAVPTDRQMRAMWGSISSYIAQGEWTSAAELIAKLIDFFETSTLPKDKFSYGASGLWLIHWAVVVSFKLEDKTTLLPLMVKDRFLNIVSISAPYLWRYISALILICQFEKLQGLPVADIAALISKDTDASQDSINRVFVDIFQNFNFNSAKSLNTLSKEEKDYYLVEVEKELPHRAVELTAQIRDKLYQ